MSRYNTDSFCLCSGIAKVGHTRVSSLIVTFRVAHLASSRPVLAALVWCMLISLHVIKNWVGWWSTLIESKDDITRSCFGFDGCGEMIEEHVYRELQFRMKWCKSLGHNLQVGSLTDLFWNQCWKLVISYSRSSQKVNGKVGSPGCTAAIMCFWPVMSRVAVGV